MSRLLKELKSLAPWQWDARVGKHPAGPATLRDFEKVGALHVLAGDTQGDGTRLWVIHAPIAAQPGRRTFKCSQRDA